MDTPPRRVPRQPDRHRMNDQRSLREQQETLLVLANDNGLYDAADWLKNLLGPGSPPAQEEDDRPWLG